MATHLDDILARTRTDVALRKAAAEIPALERRAAAHRPRGFAEALRATAVEGPAIIAELKKASPSKGLIRAEFDARVLARGLEAHGAAALSVLTDAPFFQGSLENLRAASEASTVPCLRKDFIVDEFQILESRAHGADAILLIAAALSDAELRVLREAARAMELGVLFEVHDEEEVRRIADLGCEAVGVNNRDLRTFAVELRRSEELRWHLPDGAVRVAESGIHCAADVQRLRTAGFEAFLVGESLMRQTDPGDALRRLLAPALEEV